MRGMFESLRVPVIAAPMAGGPSTPELVASVVRAGGFGFLAGGYLTAAALSGQIHKTREMAGETFGVNLFVPGVRTMVNVTPYAERLREEAERYGVRPGPGRWDDDGYAAKLDLLVDSRVPVVSFTFGTPVAADIERLHDVGTLVCVTVTTPEEARDAAAAGADVLCVQGFEAGGHRAVFDDDPAQDAGGALLGLLAALRLVRAETDLPLVAAGGLVHGADVAAVLTAGAVAAQLGTAFLRAEEAGTNATYRAALDAAGRATAITRAFSGRPARGLENRFMRDNSASAPAAYPQLNNISKPIRAAATAAGDPEAMSLWAGQTYAQARTAPASEIVDGLAAEAREAVAATARRFG